MQTFPNYLEGKKKTKQMAIMRVKLQQQVVQITETRKSNYLAGSGGKEKHVSRKIND